MNEYTKEFIDNLIKLQLTDDKLDKIIETEIALLDEVNVSMIDFPIEELNHKIYNFAEDHNIDLVKFANNMEKGEEYFFEEIRKNPLDGIFKDSPAALFVLIHDKVLHDEKILAQALKFNGLLKILKNASILKELSSNPEYKNYYEDKWTEKLREISPELDNKFKDIENKYKELSIKDNDENLDSSKIKNNNAEIAEALKDKELKESELMKTMMNGL